MLNNPSFKKNGYKIGSSRKRQKEVDESSASNVQHIDVFDETRKRYRHGRVYLRASGENLRFRTTKSKAQRKRNLNKSNRI